MSKEDAPHRFRGHIKTGRLLKTLCRLGVLDDAPPRIGKIAVIKRLRMFSFTLCKMGLIDSGLGLKEAKDYTESHWPDRYKELLRNFQ